MRDKNDILRNLSSMTVIEIAMAILGGEVSFHEVASTPLLDATKLAMVADFVISKMENRLLFREKEKQESEEDDRYRKMRHEIEIERRRLEEDRSQLEYEIHRFEAERQSLCEEREYLRKKLGEYERILREREESDLSFSIRGSDSSLDMEPDQLPDQTPEQSLEYLPLPSDCNDVSSMWESATEELSVGRSRSNRVWRSILGKFYKEQQQVFAALYAPVSTQVMHWFRVQVHLYREEDARLVSQKAKKIDRDAELMEYNPLSMEIQEGTQVKAELSFYDDGVQVNKSTQSLVWNGALTSVVFAARVEDGSLRSLAGEVTLFLENVPVGVLSFTMDVTSKPVAENNKLGSAKEFKKVFISYAHEDVKTASVMASAYRAQGIPYFFDHHSLEAGVVFDEEIKRNIEESDLFLLLWSEHAAQSAYVEKEYLHALQYAYPQKDRGTATLEFRPFLVDPVADPPAKLKSIYNFSRILVER